MILAADDELNTVQARVDTLFNIPRSHSGLYTAGEMSSALTGVFGRVVWDDQVQDGTWIEWIAPDRAIPEWSRGRLKSVAFFTELESDDPRDVWRHIERYERGRIVHELYKGTPHNLGSIQELAAHDATASLEVQLAGDGYSIVDLGVDDLAVEYVPNQLPNPEWDEDPQLCNFGASDVGAVDLVPLYHQIDRTYSSLMRDVRIAQARMFASSEVLQHRGAGQGLFLPEDQELFTQVGTGIGKEGGAESIFQFHQPAIRVLEHDQVGEMLLREVLRRTGYSPVSFGMSDEVAQTATEAAGKKESTVTTTEGKARYFGVAIQHLTTVALRIDRVKFPKLGVDLKEPLDVDWPPFAQESDLSRAQTVQAWSIASAASTRTKVRYLHQDWNEEQIDDEVELIDAANVVETPAFFGSDNGFGGTPSDANEKPAGEQAPEETNGEE
ncbi:hypothetical protein F8M49_21020 [Rhodococcus zopfii]|uniref:Portal protein n=1 Tax=Rhodococcus zopfii TaxID=43772 RepID=A0ABU3WV25_9NOCA|nr:hypothetical protein [Rhodococcus zopfii]